MGERSRGTLPLRGAARASASERGEPVGERLERELLGDVQCETLAGVGDELERAVQRAGRAARGGRRELVRAVARVDQLGRALDDHRGVAVPELDEGEAEVERADRPPSHDALDALGVLALDPAALGAGGELEVLAMALGELLAGALARGLGELEEGSPRLRLDRSRDRPDGEGLRRVAQRRPVPDRERPRALGVAEGEPSACVRDLRVDPGLREARGEASGARRLEADLLATRRDRWQHLPEARGEEDQVDEVGGLLERLQQAVGGRVAHRVGRLDHEDAAAGLERRPRRRRDDRLVDVGDEHLGGPARRDPHEVGVGPACDACAGVILVRRALAEQGGRERARDRPFAGASRPIKKVCVRGARGGQCRLQQCACVRVLLDAFEREHAPSVPPGYSQPVPRGRLITIEGIDGAGKSTLAGALRDALVARGVDVVALREPGGVAVAERIRSLVKDPGLEIAPRTEALLYAASRAQLVVEVVEPALAAGRVVLLDRYVDSSLAYQGAGRGLGVEAVAAINAFATGGLVADRTLLLSIGVAAGRARMGGREGAPDRLEREADPFFAAVAEAYAELAAREPERVRVLDGGATEERVLAEALEAIGDLV